MVDLDLSQIQQGLVIEPGDRLIVVLPINATAEHAAEVHTRLKEHLGPEIDITIMAGVQQIAVVKP